MSATGDRTGGVAVLAVSVALAWGLASSAWAGTKPHVPQPTHKPRIVRPAAFVLRQVGWASHHEGRFSRRRMADGTRVGPSSDTAASKTLPLGTTARVTNLGNGRTAIVTIRDRGPHARGRIIDVSSHVARRLGMTDAGVARVEVVALRIPLTAQPRRVDRRNGRRS